MQWILAAALMILYPLIRMSRRQKTISQISGRVDPTLHLKALNRVITSGVTPQRWLVNEAMREAFDMKDWRALSAIAGSIAFETQSPPSETSDDAPPIDASKPPPSSSPFEGVDEQEWSEFLDRFKTKEPSFKTERAVGAYHHNVERLNQLDIDPATLSDESSQRAAIAKDLVEYRRSERKLIDDFGGDQVDIEGQVHPITISGILGVIKAAGPRNARQWFKDPADREAHPHTTETFLRTNGVF